MQTNVVYLIHFNAPYKHARHYIGSAVDFPTRLAEHAKGKRRASRLMAVVHGAGISWSCVRAWVGDRTTERRIKSIGNGRKICPVCSPANRRAQFAPDFPLPRRDT